MKVVIIRHGKVDFTWKKWSTSEQFDLDCERYDEAPITSFSGKIPKIAYRNIYISSLSRSKETALQIFGQRDFIATSLIDEVPLHSSIASNAKLPLFFWNISGRLQWMFQCHRQREDKKHTMYRAEEFVKMILENGEDCAVITHGFFMHTLIDCMKKHGFRIGRTKLNYANGAYIIAEC